MSWHPGSKAKTKEYIIFMYILQCIENTLLVKWPPFNAKGRMRYDEVIIEKGKYERKQNNGDAAILPIVGRLSKDGRSRFVSHSKVLDKKADREWLRVTDKAFSVYLSNTRYLRKSSCPKL